MRWGRRCFLALTREEDEDDKHSVCANSICTKYSPFLLGIQALRHHCVSTVYVESLVCVYPASRLSPRMYSYRRRKQMRIAIACEARLCFPIRPQTGRSMRTLSQMHQR